MGDGTRGLPWPRGQCERQASAEADGIRKESWKIEGDRPLKGYELRILAEGEEMLIIKEGNSTNNYKGSDQFLAKQIDLYFTAYY